MQRARAAAVAAACIAASALMSGCQDGALSPVAGPSFGAEHLEACRNYSFEASGDYAIVAFDLQFDDGVLTGTVRSLEDGRLVRDDAARLLVEAWVRVNEATLAATVENDWVVCLPRFMVGVAYHGAGDDSKRAQTDAMLDALTAQVPSALADYGRVLAMAGQAVDLTKGYGGNYEFGHRPSGRGFESSFDFDDGRYDLFLHLDDSGSVPVARGRALYSLLG